MALEMTLKLSAPGITSLHKAGLAGLYMTLKAFNENGVKIEGLKWDLESKQVILHWTEDTQEKAFESLVNKSFWIDKKRFIRLYGLEPNREMNLEQRHLLYEALLNSFLQFGRHRSMGKKTTLRYKVDDKLVWLKEFAPIKEIRQHKTSDDFIDGNGHFFKYVDVVSWLYPGATRKHNHKKITTLKEPLNLALMLLFAPVGTIYYLIRSRTRERKSRLVLLIPEINNLEVYTELRQVIAKQGVVDLTASSSSDAALRLLLETTSLTNKLARQMRGENFSCRVITFGIVDWNKKQKTRTATRTIYPGKIKGFENYQQAHTIFSNKWQQVKEKLDRNKQVTEPRHSFVRTLCAREMIADNIASNKPWYHNISGFLANKEIREQLYYETKELKIMVKKAIFDNEREKLFIEVCHESWRRRMGKLGERAEAENKDFSDLVRKEREKLRISISRCRNAETLRETIVDFWARAGSIKQLQGNGLARILPLFDEENWRKAKDLALLALISYQDPKEKSETNPEAQGDETL